MIINNRYKLLEKIGAGRSVVYLAEDLHGKFQKIAIKILKSNISEIEESSFIKEFQTLQKFDNPGIIEAYEIGRIHKLDYFENVDANISLKSNFMVLQHFEGKTLDNFAGKLHKDNLRDLIIKIADLLFYLHQLGFVYYDLKPDNVLYNEATNEIKIIDFGLAEKVEYISQKTKKGSVRYIAPEILDGDISDHRCDLYSFGVMIYYLIENELPFKSTQEIEIIKEQLSEEIDVDKIKSSEIFKKIVTKLTRIHPSERYYTSLEVLHELDFEITLSQKVGWTKFNNFFASSQVKSLLNGIEKNSYANIIIKGIPQSGKTSTIYYLAEHADNSLVINPKRFNSVSSFYHNIIYKYLFEFGVFDLLSHEEIELVNSFMLEAENISKEQFFELFYKFILKTKFVLFIDDYNLTPSFLEESLKEFITVAQINSIKIVICTSESNGWNNQLNSEFQIFNLLPLNSNEISDLLQERFAPFLPLTQISDAITKYSDSSVSAILSALKEYAISGIIGYKSSIPTFEANAKRLKLISESQNELVLERISKLTRVEKSVLEIISAFKNVVPEFILAEILHKQPDEIKGIIHKFNNLSLVNIDTNEHLIRINGIKLKEAVYNQIEDVVQTHQRISKCLNRYKNTLQFEELYHHALKANNFKKCEEYLNDELKIAKKSGNHSYSLKLLKEYLELPIDKNKKSELQIEIAGEYFSMGEYIEANNYLENLPSNVKAENKTVKKLSVKINLATGNPLEAERKLNKFDLENDEEVECLKIEAIFDKCNYKEVLRKGKNLNKSFKSKELTGKIYNLTALSHIYENGDFDSAEKYFLDAMEKFSKVGKNDLISGALVNLGNISNIRGNSKSAVKYWDEALQLNKITGNLDQEAKLLINYGIFDFEQCNFFGAKEKYKRAHSIFKALGSKGGEGLALANLGEVNTITCDYEKAIINLADAESIFRSINNREEDAAALIGQFKLYSQLGFQEDLTKACKKIVFVVNENSLPEKYAQFVECFELLTKSKLTNNDRKRLTEILIELAGQNEDQNFAFIFFEVVESLHNQNNFAESKKFLQNELFTEIIKRNEYFSAKYYFLMSQNLISSNDSQSEGFSLLNSTYEKVRNMEITILTHQITFELAKIYVSRGNKVKAKDFIILTNGLIEYIASQIEDINLRNKYFEASKQKEIIDKLSVFSEVVK
ncbi:MAG: serine/threonine-protein kinase [Melioribacteraceae bacterium]|nr:serine/threonine-protein kinase [Melioribacteraceae bacterium]